MIKSFKYNPSIRINIKHKRGCEILEPFISPIKDQVYKMSKCPPLQVFSIIIPTNDKITRSIPENR